MLKVYQFGLSKEEGDLVNSKGWNASPKTEAYLGKYKGYQEGTGQYYTYVANVQSNELEEAFQCRVHLFIFVKVRKNWQDDPERYRVLGLDYGA